MARRRMIVGAAALVAGLSLGAFLMLRGKALPVAPRAAAPTPVTIYQWTDATGAKHLSNEPPPPGVAYETRVADGVLTTLEPPKARNDGGSPALGNPLEVYSPGGMTKLVQDAGKAADAVSQAHAQQRALIEQQK